MQVFEKIKQEAKKRSKKMFVEKLGNKYHVYLNAIGTKELDKIIDQVAVEYKEKSAWQIIYDKVVSLEYEYAENGEEDVVNDCIRLENLLQYFKEELQNAEPYKQKGSD